MLSKRFYAKKLGLLVTDNTLYLTADLFTSSFYSEVQFWMGLVGMVEAYSLDTYAKSRKISERNEKAR